MSGTGYRVRPVAGLPEIREGDDLAKLIAAAVPELSDGDVLLVTSKIVSKAEGRIAEAADREAAIDAETVRVVARRGSLRIVENRQGLVMAAAGVDASNTPPGRSCCCPRTRTPPRGRSARVCARPSESRSASSSPTPSAARGGRG
ncbi:hypothetical protein SHKM778_85050 [Streptomyces sp. KM77-8]|uniref:Coenzyme F420:L-glutamate ligase-like domain-containing protein n=1 Tax=Streptomyces haneummycinicus TaxID=3074435 RepID=A0AAT9HXK1_9ACTN